MGNFQRIYPIFTIIFLWLLQSQFPPALAKIELFEAWNRKNYKEKDVRYAMFDPEGIMTFDGNVNGKSGDLQFPNGHEQMWDQATCDKNPELLFQMCETDEHKAWTGMAICYESQLAQTDINPFFRIQNDPEWEKLVFLICGERQSALFINRTVVPPNKEDEMAKSKNKVEKNATEQGGGKYDPFYTVWTSFKPLTKIHFKMPGKPSEKRCALLRIGGENILGVSLTNLRREPLELYKDAFVFENNITAKYNTSDKEDFLQEFPDMANRKNRLSDIQDFELLLLDFMPPFGKAQNVSIYGWLPMKIKITSKAISPCRVDWRLLESREIRGRKGSLVISYTIATGSTTSEGKTEGGSKSRTNSKSDTNANSDSFTGGVPILQHTVENSFSNTYGSQQTSNSDFNVNKELMEQKSTTREETVQFDDFEGQVNVEQMLFTCHGISLFPDKIRYHDSNGRKIDPVSEDTSDPQPILLPPMPDVCQDALDTCPIWAAQDQCRKSAATMLIQCRKSCNLCTKVKIDTKKAKPMADDLDDDDNNDEDDDDECEDERKYCPAWKRMDECQKNPAYMSRFCRKSCGLCVDIDDIDDAEVELAVNRKKY